MSTTPISTRYSSLSLKEIVGLCAGPREDEAWEEFASINANPKPGVTVPLGGNTTWQSSLDSSKVWATASGHIDAGTDPNSCPNSGSIQCLLLQSVGNQKGPTGGKLLNNVTFIQRLNTNGGSAPTTACSVGQTQLQGYTADYYLYRAGN
jgi:hypothetical protein